VARILAREGVKLAVVARRRSLLEALSEEIVAAGGIAPALVEADFYPEGASEDVAARALSALGRVDILINAAGGSRPITFDATKEQWHEGMTLLAVTRADPCHRADHESQPVWPHYQLYRHLRTEDIECRI
jgi:3-oxoacyl-[acyl-carrier protein] reductase